MKDATTTKGEGMGKTEWKEEDLGSEKKLGGVRQMGEINKRRDTGNGTKKEGNRRKALE